MEEIKVKFCADCTDSIINKELKIFYKKLVITSLCNDRWVLVDHEDELLLRFCMVLEKKGFVLTYEEGDFIYSRPHGLYFDDEDGDVVVCRFPAVHLPNLFLTKIYN